MKAVLRLGCLVMVSVCAWSGLGAAENPYEGLLSRDRIGAREFVRQHPDWDGRGVVVAILDTGVDMTIPGLDKMPDGSPKVIEARDFSAQTNVKLSKPKEVMEGQEAVLQSGRDVVRGHAQLNPAPLPGTLRIGFLEERQLRNSAVTDLNNNGSITDKFAMVVGQVQQADGSTSWWAWIDTDGDGSVADEEPAGEYSETLKPILFRGQGDHKEPAQMGVALHFLMDRQELQLHIPDGAHGSHCAGIAAGYRLYGQDGYHGIAPGARVMSLKIGNNDLSGGSSTADAMSRAMEFAGQYSETHNIPVIMNVSYGIGVEIEGESDIDRIADRLLRKYPLLAMATSAGNSGPGISTVGTPAGASLAFSAGALLTRENALSLYAARLREDIVFYFSSRGGELPKPDGLAPGAAASTVPNYEDWPIMRGTSMASPQVAGAMALLASGAVQQTKAMTFTGALLARALANSGRPLAGVPTLDQGSGVIHVPTAWESLERLARRTAAGTVVGYQVRGDAPTQPDGKSHAAFYRTGTWFPVPPVPVRFEITPLLREGDGTPSAVEFFETLDLWTEGASFAKPRSDVLLFRGSGSVSLDVFLDSAALKQPGQYTAVIHGSPKGLKKDRKSSVVQLWVSVLVPHVFDLSTGFERSFDNQSVLPGGVQRYFLRVPEGASSMLVELSPVSSRFAQSRLLVFDPTGLEFEAADSILDTRRSRKGRMLVTGKDLAPGVWEVVVMSHYVIPDVSHYQLSVQFSGISSTPPGAFSFEMGSEPRGSFTLSSAFDQMFEGRLSGGISGFFKEQYYETKGVKLVIPLTIDKETSVVKLKLQMTPETYSRFTDCAVNVKDGSGRVLVKSGFGRRSTVIEVPNPGAGQDVSYLNIEIVGGLARSGGAEWGVTLQEFHHLRQVPTATLWCGGFGYFVLYPNKTVQCDYVLNSKPPMRPEGYQYFGEFRFHDGRANTTRLVIPFTF